MSVRLIVLFCSFAIMTVSSARAQDLVVGAYNPGPIGFNVATIVANISSGDLSFDPSLPVEQGNATLGVVVGAYTRTLNIGGRFASVGLAAPYLAGHIEGVLLGQFQETSRSGIGDLSGRIAINLHGARAMTLPEFARYRPTNVFGLSLAIGIPVGQYDPARVINIGTNRWSFKPEAGFMHTRGRWTFEADAGATLFTDNTNFRNGGTYDQAPILATQFHVMYTIRPAFWVAGDANFWSGGRTTTNGLEALEQQHNSRAGLTVAIPIRKRQLRIAYSAGTYTRLGGDFSTLGVSYSYAWAGRP
jgi:hypothetical protein